MKILKIILVGYKRLSLNNINRLEFTPKKPITLILGTNGSGKSSLLKELTVFPANIKKEYKEGGYKEIFVEHNGNSYILSSGKEKNKHSFIKNDVELNTGGTKKIQTTLIEDEFKIKDNHDVMIGTKNFTSMSTNERKAWFTEIANVDYTYALNVYMEAKNKLRDITGAIKISKTKIPSEELVKINNETLEKDKELLKFLDEFKNTILTSISIDVHKDIYKDINIERFNVEYSKLLDSIDEFKSKANIGKIIYSDIDKEIQKRDYTIEKLTQDNSKINKEISNLIELKNIDNMDELISVQQELFKEIKELESSFPLKTDKNNLEALIDVLNRYFSDITSLVIELSNYSEYLFKHNYSELKEKHYELNTYKNRILGSISKLEGLIESQEAAKSNHVTCVNCNHNWSIGFDEEKYIEYNKKLEFYKEKLNSTDKELERLSVLLEKQISINNIFNNINSISIMHPSLKLLVDESISNLQDHKNPNKINDELFVFKTKVMNLTNLSSKYRKLDEITKKIDTGNMLKDKIKESNLSSIDKLEKELLSNKYTISNLKIETDNYKTLKELMGALIKYNRALKIFNKNRKSKLENDIKIERNNSLKEMLNLIKENIIELDNKINNTIHENRIYDKLRKDIDVLVKREDSLKKLVNALSPNDGLIAKSITGFLDKFISEINSIIKSVWNYGLTVENCNADDSTDLDYKFPVNIDGTHSVDDVKNTSASMNEIINLAFKIVSMKYLKMDTYPLFLDEFGRTMDNDHRVKAFRIVDSLMETTFDQIFIVSHFESVYARFNDADVIVLSEDNLNLDSTIKYNSTLKIS